MEIVLGVTGGIAAYKAADLVRALRRAGAGVTVVMTRHAREFITPLTLQTLSGRRVIVSHFELSGSPEDEGGPGDVEHIGLARQCDLLLVAPATADVLGKMAAGICDDFLTTFYLAVTCPVAVAPAMNTTMWGHPAVRDNVARLEARGVHVIGPEFGEMASPVEGSGMGRLAQPETIARRALDLARGGERQPPAGGPLAGRRVLVTAGPTREELDPVRFLSNPSSGKMGYAVAEAARDLGAEVVLISGPTTLPDPPGLTVRRVTTALQMRDAVIREMTSKKAPVQEAKRRRGKASTNGAGGPLLLVMAAAVSDFRPAERSPGKVKKEKAPLRVALERTPDILAEVSRLPGKRFVVGFAAETGDLAANARRKLKSKKLDLIVANNVADDGRGGAAASGFAGDTNEVIVIDRDGKEQRWPRMTKRDVAARLMALVSGRLA